MNYKRFFCFLGNTILLVLLSLYLRTFVFGKCIDNVLTDTSSFLSLVYVRNNGAAFNLFAGYNEMLIVIAIIMVLLCLGYTLTFKLFISDKFLFVMASFCAGVIGNAYERIAFGYVSDFIKVNLFNFPVFNINDIMITFGASILAITIAYDRYREYKETKDVEEDDLYREL